MIRYQTYHFLLCFFVSQPCVPVFTLFNILTSYRQWYFPLACCWSESVNTSGLECLQYLQFSYSCFQFPFRPDLKRALLRYARSWGHGQSKVNTHSLFPRLEDVTRPLPSLTHWAHPTLCILFHWSHFVQVSCNIIHGIIGTFHSITLLCWSIQLVSTKILIL